MNLREAIAACDSDELPTLRPRIRLWARRTNAGTTILYGNTPGFQLPEGINDAEVTITPEHVVFYKDRTQEFCGHSYIDIMERGNSIIKEREKEN